MWLQEQIPRKHVFERDWITTQNMITILESTIELIWEGVGGGQSVYDHVMSTRNFTLIMSNIFIRAPKITRKVAMTLI